MRRLHSFDDWPAAAKSRTSGTPEPTPQQLDRLLAAVETSPRLAVVAGNERAGA